LAGFQFNTLVQCFLGFVGRFSSENLPGHGEPVKSLDGLTGWFGWLVGRLLAFLQVLS